jgi:hypothetical protein
MGPTVSVTVAQGGNQDWAFDVFLTLIRAWKSIVLVINSITMTDIDL